MPAYSYEAMDAQGTPVRGTLDAESPRAARGQLRVRALIPVRVDPLGQAVSGWRRYWPVRSRWPGAEGGRVLGTVGLGVFTRQLAGLVGAGLPLERALQSLAEEAGEPRQQALLSALRSEVHGGNSFANALSQHPADFSVIYTAVVAAGEQSGALGIVLERLADDLEERELLRGKIIGAALYPAIVTVFALVIVTFLLSYVVPQVAGVFAGTRHALPLLTSLMLALSHAVRDWGWLMAVLLVGGLLALRQALRRPRLRRAFDARWLALPVLGRIARGYNGARFAATLAMLSAAGVPILRALQAAADTLGNQALRADALQALERVREGAPIAAALAQGGRFPALLVLFARLGEQTGTLPDMLQRAARQLSADVQRRAMQLATVLEPVLIVVMGLVVMLIVLAVLLPIIQLNQWVR